MHFLTLRLRFSNFQIKIWHKYNKSNLIYSNIKIWYYIYIWFWYNSKTKLYIKKNFFKMIIKIYVLRLRKTIPNNYRDFFIITDRSTLLDCKRSYFYTSSLVDNFEIFITKNFLPLFFSFTYKNLFYNHKRKEIWAKFAVRSLMK